MNTQKWFAIVSLLALLLSATTARAQYTDNNQTNTITGGVISNWTAYSGSYYVGTIFSYDVLIITNASTLNNTNGYLGYSTSSSNNAVTVTGSGSVWTNRSDLNVGYQGAGNTLTINNSGAVFAANAYVGYTVGASNNAVTVSGTGSFWRSMFYVGYDGSGNQLTITNGGRVVGLGYVGYNISASNNAVTVSGTGSVWSNYSGPYNLDVGYDGSGNQLTITNGGRVFTSRDGVVGHFGDARNNAVTVSGTGSVWNNARDLDVGFMGSGNQLTITDSGTVVVAQNAYVGYVVIATNNTVLVTGAGSVLSNGVSLYVGFMGSGNSLIITNGGAVTVAQNAYVGYDASASNNQITLAGGSLITTNTGHGVLDVRGGAVTMDSGTIMARTMLLTNGVTGTLNMSGGTLAANTITNDGSANVVLSGGTLKPLNANADWSAALVVSNTVTLNTVDVGSQVRTNVLSGALSGGGTLNVTGTGTLRMNGTDTGGGWINVQSGATLGGTGSMASVQIFSNATLAAGNSIGTLTATNLTLAGGAHVQVEINATNGTKGVDWDLITVNGPAALSSISASTPLTVDVVNYGGLNGAQAPLSTVSWDFLDASNITGFDSNAFAFTTTGLDGWSSGNWSVTQTGNSLLLSYTAIPEPVSVALVCLLGGGLMAWRRLRRWGT